MYSWIIDETKPFKLQCPECKTVFPDNDYTAYLQSGLKDKSLLTGKCVDDGRGWKDGDKPGKYWFVAYYNHWTLKRRIEKLLPQLANAYARTGDPAFAERALVMLDKLAEYYPATITTNNPATPRKLLRITPAGSSMQSGRPRSPPVLPIPGARSHRR